MNEAQIHECAYWRHELIQRGPQGFAQWRLGLIDWNREHFQGHFDLRGKGIEIGTGPISGLTRSEAKSVVTLDPLQDIYFEHLVEPCARECPEIWDKRITYLKGDGEALDFADGSFDWAVCINVIDHTPHPERMAEEIYRVLKKGGFLYYSVNFDYALAPAHYKLWRQEDVDENLKQFVAVWEHVYPMPHWNQDEYFGVYAKEAGVQGA